MLVSMTSQWKLGAERKYGSRDSRCLGYHTVGSSSCQRCLRGSFEVAIRDGAQCGTAQNIEDQGGADSRQNGFGGNVAVKRKSCLLVLFVLLHKTSTSIHHMA